MIENHRDKELCRRWDALADEYHTHHLTTQEYSLLQEQMVASFKKSKVVILCHWGIDLISSMHCLSCNDCNKKQEKNHMCPLTLTITNNGRHEVHLLHGGNGKVHGGLLILPKVTMEMHQVLNERCVLLNAVFGKVSSWWFFHEFNSSQRSTVTDGDPISRCEIYKNLGYRLSGRSQRQEHHWRHEAQDQHEAQHETLQCVQRLETLGGTRERVRNCCCLRGQSLFLLLSHSSFAHRTVAQDVCVSWPVRPGVCENVVTIVPHLHLRNPGAEMHPWEHDCTYVGFQTGDTLHKVYLEDFSRWWLNMQAGQSQRDGPERDHGFTIMWQLCSIMAKQSSGTLRPWTVYELVFTHQPRSHEEVQLQIHHVNTTPQMNRFRGAKVCSKWLQERIDDHSV